MESRGKLIAFEGLDGSGKSTQVQLLVKYLKEKGYTVLLTKEPTDSPVGMLIKKYLKNSTPVSSIMLQLLFSADRARHLEETILPALSKGTIVICDRYVFSSVAYGAIDTDMLWLHDINKNFLHPDITIYIKVPPVVCFQRIDSKKDKHFYEAPEKLEIIYKNYERITRSFPAISTIDGNRAVNEVFDSVKSVVHEKLGL